MFNRILIANRGEIAVRIRRACAELGVGCVLAVPQSEIAGYVAGLDDIAVVRDDDPVTGAPVAVVGLPGVGPRAYLDIDAVVAAARRAGCDAVHPGYGFLSENDRFAAACASAGVAFIGSSATVLATFGDKTAARTLAARCDVAVPAGTSGPTTLAQAARFLAAR